MNSQKLNILVAAGGTGGHLFPAIAVVEALEELSNGYLNFIFAGTPNRIEAKVVPDLGYEFHSMDIAGYTGMNFNLLKLPFKINKAVNKCRKLIREKNITAALATGAYISYPPGQAAAKEKKPLVLMESNVNPGKAVKLLSGKADLILTSFADSSGYFNESDRKKILTLGNPVRKDILNLPDKNAAKEKFGLSKCKKILLVFGGSLGAASINDSVSTIIPFIKEKDYGLLWQTGNNFEKPDLDYENIKILLFIEDMASAYAASDLVVSRSGATTIAELTVSAKPSILVPLPSASNSEQLENAKVMDRNNAAILLNDSELNDKLPAYVKQLMENDEMLRNYADNSFSLGRPKAASDCANEILNLIKVKN